ncbi:hypothetical protein ACF06P_08675 [Streptomyces sp. NPDC015684]|uniref:hypothetical protein n=1 Tax=Streptomyces sp. NPDC015684 TaxID=3364963 RepID=UPI0036FE7347
MSNHEPDDNGDWRIEPPAPSRHSPDYGRYHEDPQLQQASEQQYVGLYSEAHDHSRVYMAGRDQFITQTLDLSVIREKIKKWYYEQLATISPFFCGWALRAFWVNPHGPDGWNLGWITFFLSLFAIMGCAAIGVDLAVTLQKEVASLKNFTVTATVGFLLALLSFFVVLFFTPAALTSYGESFVDWLAGLPSIGKAFS